MSAVYELRIADLKAVEGALAALGHQFREAVAEHAQAQANEMIKAFDDPNVAGAYAAHLALVGKFLNAELDTESPSERGLGRIADSDPPPRIGSKFRDELGSDEARCDVGQALENLLIGGFAAQAALSAGGELVDRSNEETWELWLRHLAPFYAESNLGEVLGESASTSGGLGTMAVIVRVPLDEYVEAGQKHDLVKKSVFRAAKTGRAMTMAYFSFGAGRALHRVLTDAVDRDLGSTWPVELLAHYQEPRKAGELI